MSVVYAILEERGFYRGFTRGTTGACRIGSELPSNEDQCTQAQYFGLFRHMVLKAKVAIELADELDKSPT